MTNTTIERIKKLLALASSPNPHEAAQAAAMAADLMERHGVESADLQGDDVSPVSSQEADHEEPWYRTLIHVVAKNMTCECWYEVHRKKVVVVGRGPDLAATMLLCAWLRSQLIIACAKERRNHMHVHGKTFSASFYAGAVAAINDRFRLRTISPVASDGTPGLTLVQTEALARYRDSAEDAIVAWKRAHGIKTISRSSRRRSESGAYEAGRRAGDAASMSAPKRALTA